MSRERERERKRWRGIKREGVREQERTGRERGSGRKRERVRGWVYE